MAASSTLSNIFALCFFITALILLSSSRAVVASGDHENHLMGWMPTRSGCRGTSAECLATDEEFELDSEASRRILATSRYISYGALHRNTILCSRRGASYYNCQYGAQANSWCNTITRCRS